MSRSKTLQCHCGRLTRGTSLFPPLHKDFVNSFNVFLTQRFCCESLVGSHSCQMNTNLSRCWMIYQLLTLLRHHLNGFSHFCGFKLVSCRLYAVSFAEHRREKSCSSVPVKTSCRTSLQILIHTHTRIVK